MRVSLAKVALPLASGLGAAKPPLSDEYIQDAVDETAADPYQAVLSARRAGVGVGTGGAGCGMASVARRARIRRRAGMIGHAEVPGKNWIDVRQGGEKRSVTFVENTMVSLQPGWQEDGPHPRPPGSGLASVKWPSVSAAGSAALRRWPRCHRVRSRIFPA